jgi:hypothetical protein
MKPIRTERWQRGPLAWMTYNRITPNLLMVALLLGGFFVSGQIKKEVFPEFESKALCLLSKKRSVALKVSKS